MKEAITKLTASKDVIGAARCGLIKKVEEILDKDVRSWIFYINYRSTHCILEMQIASMHH
jgi:hypothetical protein